MEKMPAAGNERPKRNFVPWIIAIGSVLAIAGVISVVFLFDSFGNDKISERDRGNIDMAAATQSMPASDLEETTTIQDKPVSETEKPTTKQDKPAAGAEKAVPIACGDWYMYSEGTADMMTHEIPGAEVTEFCLKENGEASITYYVTNSDVGYSYSGTWSSKLLSSNTVEISFQMFGGYAGLTYPGDSTENELELYSVTIVVDITDKWMTIQSLSGSDWFLKVGDELEKNLTPEQWVEDVFGTLSAAA